MAELEFPSGPWTGFYNYGSGAARHPMDLFLNFSGGKIFGEGQDKVGQFVVSGGYDGSGECRWTKNYLGSHSVDYRRFRESKGIWGVWEIVRDGRGGFHIWPLGSGNAEKAQAESTEKDIPVETILTNRPEKSAVSR